MNKNFRVTASGCLLLFIAFLTSRSVSGENAEFAGIAQQKYDTLIIKELNIVNKDTGLWNGYEINRSYKKRFIFRNNSVRSANSSGYMLHAGDEAPGKYNNTIDGMEISGNKFEWEGTNNASITHAIFTGFNRNAVLKYNYLHRTPMGLIRKSAGMTDESGGIGYNIVNDPLKVAVVVKGMNNIKIVNNTFYSERTPSETWRPLIHIYSNDNPQAASTGVKIFNNIFYTRHRLFNITIEKNCLDGFECDYNVYWCEEGEPIFLVGGEDMSFSKWQSLGYDKHSRVLNPKFINTIDFVPAVPLTFGKDLGPEWKYGLSVGAKWGKSDPAVTEQKGIWQIGARLYALQESTTYYVSPDGKDSNPGTRSQPFATWQKGFLAAEAGDTLFIRGGTYRPDGIGMKIFDSEFFCGVTIKNKSGKPGEPIHVIAYPGEKPVLDCSSIVQSGYCAGIVLYECNYWELKGLEVTHASQQPRYGAFGVYLNSSDFNVLDQIVSHDNGGSGIRVGYESEGNLIINCDAYNNYDLYSTAGGKAYHGGNADGIEVSDIFGRAGNERVNTLIGCRSWHNSDDGYDFFRCDGVLIMKNCWAWNNGYDEGDGDGFKLGSTRISSVKPMRFLSGCLSFSNSAIGFDQNEADVAMCLTDCIAYKNGTHGYNFQYFNLPDTLKYNISYENGRKDLFGSDQIQEHNSWQTGVKIKDSDFESVIQSGLDGPRLRDGQLPPVKFLRLKENSPVVKAGLTKKLLTKYEKGYNYDDKENKNIKSGTQAAPGNTGERPATAVISLIRIILIIWPGII
jgi:hypothetical protein